MKPATLAVHAGVADPVPGQPVLSPLVPATSFHAHPDSVGFSANDLTEKTPHFYARWSNPTAETLEQRLAALDGGEAALSFASGMAAISGLFLHTLKAGDHLVLSNVCYAGVAELAHDILPKMGILVTPVDTSNLQAVADALRPTTRLVHVETPANPILRLADIAAIAAAVHSHGALLSVDATMATPIAIQPLDLGADFVVHSLTKYACGHGDALGGAVIGKASAIAALRKESLIHFGGAISPFAAWLILRGLETLPMRMATHQTNAAAVTEFLRAHPRVDHVLWPGSATHPQHDLARRQMRNFSGMVSFSAKNDPDLARRLADRLKLVAYAVSLGKTRSLVFYIPTEDIISSSFHLDAAAARDYRDWTGEGTFRLSVGIEDPADIIADLEQALG
ncbi:aminotransferase class I/II-fold pyridoxal phosphate-dependent enzyme [Telmatospirillum sp.]|uniref:trans-sulfuration enzyme family protein n=1 Tax=Telmatospirillum sp. TaxID=2079197 RepID=UPI00283EED36|nr:aminotransferase class I/II-fold pyridoxal phosphate-dependent enzyme [Telmatospirillum sp.]MDR3435812.1 aminotransferase class I/II-fold pyridoxal phosphate-dependent enzyme [Telmatospirillum sp.]